MPHSGDFAFLILPPAGVLVFEFFLLGGYYNLPHRSYFHSPVAQEIVHPLKKKLYQTIGSHALAVMMV